MNADTGERISGRCKAYCCMYCGPKKLWLLELCLVAARPERFVTLTLASADHQRRRGEMRELAYRVRKAGYSWECAWVHEPNPRGTGHHIHALQKGDYIPQRVLQQKWGDRVTHVKAIKNHAGGVGAYMLKVQRGSFRASGYVLKEQEGRSRPVNITRGFFDGRKLEEVRGEVRALMFGERTESNAWVRVPRCA